MKKALSLFLLMAAYAASAQANLDSLEQKVNKMDKLLNVLREFRIVVFLQPQFQHADTQGISSYAGGDFPAHSDNRFLLRRGRLRVSYEHENIRHIKVVDLAFMFDATEKGFMVKEAYGRVNDPWTGWLGLQAGIYNRPFGYEVTHLAVVREVPEFARMSQVLFPGECDLGAGLIVESPAKFKPVYLRLDAGAYNGLGSTVAEFDRRKDFIGHVQARKTFGDKLKYTIWGGASYYYGAVMQSTPAVYALTNNFTGDMVYQATIDTASVNKKYYKREYYGADLQFGIDYKSGTTTLRGEFIAGQQPGTLANPTVPVATGSDLYIRSFNGAYFTFVQTFKHKLKSQAIYHDIVFRYEWYDPNTKLKGADLALALGSKSDIKYQTFGVGYIFRPANWFKLLLYYDIVKNENTSLNGFTSDLRDNVFTLRTQFTFDSNWFKK